MLFEIPEHDHLDHCTKCGAARRKQVGDSHVPLKVLRHFPLIDRLKKMFSSSKQAALQTWWWHNKSTNGLMRHAADSPQWTTTSGIHETFSREPRNIRLGMATDRLNPFSMKNTKWSTWPVLLINYNVPPWQAMKKHFLMLSLIIPGPRSVTGQHFDVYIEPLLRELLVL